jgi:hypothetical protein
MFSIHLFWVCCAMGAVQVHHVPFYGEHPLGVAPKNGPVANSSDIRLEPEGVVVGRGARAPMIKLPDWTGRQGTVAFWVKAVDWDATTQEHVVFIKPVDAVNGSFLIYKYINSDKLWFYSALETGPKRDRVRVNFAYDGLTAWKRGQWHHLAFVWKCGTVAKLFMDGVLTNTAKGEFYFPESMAGITFGQGGRVRGMGGKTQSIVRDLHVSASPISDTEIALLAQDPPKIAPAKRQEAGPPPPAPNPPTILPIGSAHVPPQVDGVIDEYEYATVVPGLIAADRHLLYPEPAQTCFAADDTWLYAAARIALPEGHTPTSIAAVRDSPAQVAKGDLFCMFIRADADVTATAYTGTYITVSPNGNVYDATESIDWGKMSCTRDTGTDIDLDIRSMVSATDWTVELRLPRTALGLEEKHAFSVSAGFKLGNLRATLQDHPIWFDHHQAFSRAIFTDLSVNCGLSGLGWGNVAARFSVHNPTQEPAACRATIDIALPSIRQTAAGMVVDQTFGERIEVTARETVHQWSEELQISPSTRAEAGKRWDLPDPGTYMLTTVLTQDDNVLWRLVRPFAVSPPLDVDVRPRPSAQELDVTLSFCGLDPDRLDAVELTLTDAGQQRVWTAEHPVLGKSQTEVVPMRQLGPGSYNVHVSARDRSGKVVAAREAMFNKQATPHWLANRRGLGALAPDWVPAPWTPLAVRNSTVSLWGRTFTFAAPSLLAGMKSQNVEMLASGAEIVVETATGKHRFEISKPLITEERRGRVLVAQSGTGAGIALNVRHQIEFDGMDRLDLEFTPTRPTPVKRLWVELPFRDPHFMYVTQPGAWTHGEVADAQWTILPHIWLGNDDVGCAFFAESCKGWLISSTKPRVTLTRRDGVTTVRLLLVNEPCEMLKPMAVTFGLHPTPIKPFFPGWRALRPQGWGWTKPPTSLYMAGPTAWMSSYSVPTPRNWTAVTQMVAYARKYDQTVYPYLTPFSISMYDMIRRDLPYLLPGQKAPDGAITHQIKDSRRIEPYWYYAADWNLGPPRFTGDGSARETTQMACVSPSSSWADYLVGNVHEILSKSDVDGFYFDLASPRLNYDEGKGLSYTTRDGVSEGTREYFAARDLYKRLYHVFDELRGPARKPYILGHGSPSHCPISSFWDINFHGEGVKPRRKLEATALFTQKQLKGNPIAAPAAADAPRSFDAVAYRAANGAQFGLPVMYLPQYGYRRELLLPEHSREHLSWTFLHNNLLWPAYIPSGPVYDFWRAVEIPFGMDDAVFHPYWRNVVRAKPECIRVSYWRKNARPAYLLAAANWSTAVTDATIELPPELAQLTWCDAESGTAIAPGSTIKLRIPPCDLRVLRAE